MAATQQQLDEVSGRILRQSKQVGTSMAALANKLNVMAQMVCDDTVPLARLVEVWQDVQASANEYASIRGGLETDKANWAGATGAEWTAE